MIYFEGKGHVVNFLVEKGYFPLQGFIVIDPDEIRRRLPEYSMYIEHCPEKAGNLTHKEAGYIAEILTGAALQGGKNALVDGSLRNWKWYKELFHQLKKDYHTFSIAILLIIAPREAVFERAMHRAKLTGRVIPQETLEMALEEVPKAVKILSPLVDYFCELDNAPGKIKIVTPNITWESFGNQWLQTCAWVPKSRRLRRVSVDLKSFRLSSQRFLQIDLNEYTTKTLGRQQQLRNIFSTSLSTEENYSAAGDEKHCYYGPYSHIRRELNYDYYSNYVKERQWLQDSIIEGILKAPIIVSKQQKNNSNSIPSRTPSFVENPWIVYIIGNKSVGKAYCVRELIKRNKFTLNSFIYLNNVRSHIPEYFLYAKLAANGNHKHCHMTADEATFKECVYTQDILITAALQSEQNILIYVQPDTIQHFLNIDFLQRIRDDFSMYRIALMHVVSPDNIDDSTQSFKDKPQAKNKISSDLNNEKNEAQIIKQTATKAAAMVDFYCELCNHKSIDNNNKDDKDNDDIKIVVPNNMSWDDFQKKWEQSSVEVNKDPD